MVGRASSGTNRYACNRRCKTLSARENHDHCHAHSTSGRDFQREYFLRSLLRNLSQRHQPEGRLAGARLKLRTEKCCEIHHSLTYEQPERNIPTIHLSTAGGCGHPCVQAWPPLQTMHSPPEPVPGVSEANTAPAARTLIFVVEDDEDIARLVSHNLQAAGFEVQSFVNGASLIAEASREQPSLFLLDIMLPGANGFDLCRQIRQTPKLSSIPIIFLTAKTAEADRVKGLELGGDDYITKPFSPRELVARVRSVLRGLRQSPAMPEVLRLGEIEIDPASMKVQVQGRPVLTTVREFRLLEYLATHCGRVLTRDQLLDAVWKETPFVTPRSIDVYVRRLREKIESDSRHPKYLKTLRGIGYRFEIPK
jgi:DNA-binding response OmpR family regulator